jgi:uncharacterized protein YndB with AHSA1/START domain
LQTQGLNEEWIHHEPRVERDITIAAPLGKVWRAWIEPEHLAGWFVDEAEGEMEVGGTYRWTWQDFGLEVPHDILALEPRRRLVLSAQPPDGPRSLLEIRLTRRRKGTGVRVIQSALPDDGDGPGDVESGWEMALALLKTYVEEHFGRCRRGRFLAQPAGYEPRELAPFFREGSALSRWLTRGGHVGPVGSLVELELQDGTPLTGRVLVDTGQEVALSWREIEGALELKAFSAGPEQRVVGMRLHRWDGGPTEQLESTLSRSLDRLVSAGFLPAYAR